MLLNRNQTMNQGLVDALTKAAQATGGGQSNDALLRAIILAMTQQEGRAIGQSQ